MPVRRAVSAVITAGRAHSWLVYLSLCGGLVGAFFLALLAGTSTPGWGVARSLMIDGILTLAAVAMPIGIRRNRPARAAGWYLAMVALVLTAIAHLTWSVGVLALGMTAFRSLSEALYLACYPIGALALGWLLRARNPGHDRASILDAIIYGVALALLAWPFLIEPFMSYPGLQPATRLHGVVAPLFDIALLSLLLRLASRRRVFALRLVITGVVIVVASDALYALRRLPNVDDAPSMLELGWAVSCALLGAASLHPSMRLVGDRAIPPATRLDRRRIALLLGLALTSPTALAVMAISGLPVRLPVMIVGAGLLFITVLTRMSTLASQEHARSDLQELMLERIVQATEHERNRIAADLHDGPIQRLGMIPMTVALVRGRFERGDHTGGYQLLASLERLIGDEIKTLRQLMAELRPPVLDEWGLAAALDQCAKEFTRRTGTACDVAAEEVAGLDSNRETVVYRVVQEALNNVGKHARARQVRIALGVEGETVNLVVADDGVGFEVDLVDAMRDPQRFGLVTMRQRVTMAGGTFQVQSSPGKGTTIHVHLSRPAAPLVPEATASAQV